MIFNTVYGVSGDVYENGDNIAYPTTSPIGGVKLYTEDYVANIANAIRSATASTNTYTISQMSYAILNEIPRNGMKVFEIDIIVSNYTLVE